MNKQKLLCIGITLFNAGFCIDGAFVGPANGNPKGEVLPEIAGRKIVIWNKKNGQSLVQAATDNEESMKWLASHSKVIRNLLLSPSWQAGNIYSLETKHSFEHVSHILQNGIRIYNLTKLFSGISNSDIIEALFCAEELEMPQVLEVIHRGLVNRMAEDPPSTDYILATVPKSMADAMRYFKEIPNGNGMDGIAHGLKEKLYLIATDPEKDIFAAASSDNIIVYDLEKNNVISRIKIAPTNTAKACAINHKHNIVVVASKLFKSDTKSIIECFDLKTGEFRWKSPIIDDICKIAINESSGNISFISSKNIIEYTQAGAFDKTQKHEWNPEYFKELCRYIIVFAYSYGFLG